MELAFGGAPGFSTVQGSPSQTRERSRRHFCIPSTNSWKQVCHVKISDDNDTL